jgi:hypothetical protein
MPAKPLMFLLALTGALWLATGSASAQRVAFASNFNARPLCIDVPNSQYTAGTQLIVYPCQRSANQYFTPTQSGIRAGNTNLCIDAFRPGGGASQIGDVIGIWNCQNSQNQSWFLNGIQGPPTSPTVFSLQVVSGNNVLCMEVTGFNPQAQVGRLALNRCTNALNQQFRYF